MSFYNLGVAHFTRFEETGGLKYLEEFITYHRDALELNRFHTLTDVFRLITLPMPLLHASNELACSATWTGALPMLARPWS